MNKSQTCPGPDLIGGQVEGVGSESSRHEVIRKSGAMLQHDARPKMQDRRGFHDAKARETYASQFRPIAIQAVAAGTRQMSGALRKHGETRKADLPGVLRHGFAD